MINQATLCLGLFNYAYLSPSASDLPLLKPNAQVSAPEDGVKCYFASLFPHVILVTCNKCDKSPFSACHHHLPLTLVYGGEWLDLTYGTPGAGPQSEVFGPKTQLREIEEATCAITGEPRQRGGGGGGGGGGNKVDRTGGRCS
jgi:hypothetical protein